MKYRRSLVSAVRVVTLVVGVLALLNAVPASAQTVQQGDVFASVNNGNVDWYRSDGTFVKTINTGVGGYTTGGAFDSSGNFYVTNFSAASVTKFDNMGNVVNTYPTGGSSPESILFDAAGDIYVGHASGGKIRKFDSSFTFIETYAHNGASDWIDLRADQCGMLYTFEGTSIESYDLCTKTQLATFASALGGQAFALRIRPNGEVMLANGPNILRLNAAGGTMQTYQPGGELSGWFALNLDPDGTSFWTGTFTSGNFYKVDIATGNVLLGPIATCGSTCLYGLTVAGELIVAQPTPTPTPAGQPTPTPTATAIPATPTPPTPVPVTGRGGLAILVGLLALSGALILWRWSSRS
jgi:hypothetical protein